MMSWGPILSVSDSSSSVFHSLPHFCSIWLQDTTQIEALLELTRISAHQINIEDAGLPLLHTLMVPRARLFRVKEWSTSFTWSLPYWWFTRLKDFIQVQSNLAIPRSTTHPVYLWCYMSSIPWSEEVQRACLQVEGVIILSWTVSSSFVLNLAPRLHSRSINHPNKLTFIFHCAHGFVFTRLVDCVDGLCLIWMVCAAPNPDCLKFAKWNRWSANRICSSNHIQTWMNLIRISCCFCYCIDVKIEVGTDSIYWHTSIRECAIYHENIALVCLDWVRHSFRFNHALVCLNEFNWNWIWLRLDQDLFHTSPRPVGGGVKMTEMH
jgi:hypothetical protein